MITSILNDKKKKAIVFCATKNMAFAIASVIMDLQNTKSDVGAEYVVLHDGFCKRDKRAFSKIADIRFIKYCFPVKDKSIFHSGTFNYFTEMVYAKLECFKLLDEYETILFTDYDVLIKSSIAELFDIKDSFAILISEGSTVRDQFSTNIPGFDMDKMGVTASLFLLRDTLPNYKEIYKWCYEMVVQYASLLRFPEQGVIALAIQFFKINTGIINPLIFCVHPDNFELYPDAKILHAYGARKFWNGIYINQWANNYKRWLDLGGSGYKKKPTWPLRIRISRKVAGFFNRK